ncbi:hypothetical protein ACOJUR_08205 [Alicyclobacillus tolerans]|uniref:hypothetical protein n=1 Tax=Alicyclobacillus tolerans TaxID=90970 RepID=UPI003B7D702B
MLFFPWKKVGYGTAALVLLAGMAVLGGGWLGRKHAPVHSNAKSSAFILPKGASPKIILPGGKAISYPPMVQNGLLVTPGGVDFVPSLSFTGAPDGNQLAAFLSAEDRVSFVASKGQVQVTLDAPLPTGVTAEVNGKTLQVNQTLTVPSAKLVLKDGEASAQTFPVIVKKDVLMLDAPGVVSSHSTAPTKKAVKR